MTLLTVNTTQQLEFIDFSHEIDSKETYLGLYLNATTVEVVLLRTVVEKNGGMDVLKEIDDTLEDRILAKLRTFLPDTSNMYQVRYTVVDTELQLIHHTFNFIRRRDFATVGVWYFRGFYNHLLARAKALNVTIEYLLTGSNDPEGIIKIKLPKLELTNPDKSIKKIAPWEAGDVYVHTSMFKIHSLMYAYAAANVGEPTYALSKCLKRTLGAPGFDIQIGIPRRKFWEWHRSMLDSHLDLYIVDEIYTHIQLAAMAELEF